MLASDAYQPPLMICCKLASMAESEINIVEPFKHCLESATETPCSLFGKITIHIATVSAHSICIRESILTTSKFA